MTQQSEELCYGPRFLTNGYLVVIPWIGDPVPEYRGIDDYAWPIESDNLRKLTRQLGVPEQSEGVRVATDWEKTLAYYHRCLSQELRARLLLVSTRYTLPRVVPQSEGWTFLGYDLADPLGSHSLLRHEVIAGRAPQLAHWRSRINLAGLLPDVSTAEEYLREREALVERGMRHGMELSPAFEFVPVRVDQFTGELSAAP